MRSISIIGADSKVQNGTHNGTQNGTKALETNLDDSDMPPPPPQGKRKVIVAQRPHNFIWNLKVSYISIFLEL